MKLEVIEDISERQFVENYIARNTPVVVRGIPYSAKAWEPAAISDRLGDLTTQVYDTLFELEGIMSLSEYIFEYFKETAETSGPVPDNVPYVRWYNQLKDTEFVWGDEAFSKLTTIWKKPRCIPADGLVVPALGSGANPVTDPFPYRAIQVAARGARTRLHRDPFCSDAVVSQFYGRKKAVLYHPDRAQELTLDGTSSSFGGFMDVRAAGVDTLSVVPDFEGEIVAGDMIFIPHGWLHDVLVVEDSISVTWNFVHKRAAREHKNYLRADPEADSEFEVLQYFYQIAGKENLSASEMLAFIEQ